MSDNLIFPELPGGPSNGGPSDGGARPDDPAADFASAEPDSFVEWGPAEPADEGFDLSFSDVGADLSGDGAPAAEPLAEAIGTPETSPTGKPSKDKRVRGKDALVLGVHVTPKQVYGVLVRPTSDGFEPLRQFVRNRSAGQYGGPGGLALTPDEVGEEEPALEMAATDDVQVQFGGVGEIDFSAEFAGIGVAADAAFENGMSVGEVDLNAQPIVFELRDILDECEQAGFGNPALAFAVDAPDVEYVEVAVLPEKKSAKKSKKGKKGKTAEAPEAAESGPVKRERLLELLPDLSPSVDRGRIAFVPMTERDGVRRYMAVVPTASEPVAESLAMLREQAAYRRTSFRTLEAEVPLLVGLVRLTLAPGTGENTAVVRVGAEDTIVLLLTGGEIHHYEQMQSVTAFDGPDTICSRVLLQQDVQGVGTVHNVVIVAEEREKELVQGFAAFYPEARVETLREGLATVGLVGPYGPLAPVLVEAAGAALAGHLRPTKGGGNDPFEAANLLPASLLKRRRSFDLTFNWHTLVATVLLFLSVLYFSYLYVAQEGAIAQAEQQLAEYPPEAKMSVPQLQARIDSLHFRQAELTASLTALDSLLVGTDFWTQTMLRATRAAAQTGGIWIEEWSPSGSSISLKGYATTRENVVGLGQRLGATIESVSFQTVRDYPVYEYQMRFDQPRELPQVTRVMREQAAARPEAPGPLAGTPSTSLPAAN